MANPTSEDVMLSNLTVETWGLKAQQKEAKRCLDYVHGHVNSYCAVVNGPENMERLKQHISVAASLAELQAEKDKRRR